MASRLCSVTGHSFGVLGFGAASATEAISANAEIANDKRRNIRLCELSLSARSRALQRSDVCDAGPMPGGLRILPPYPVMCGTAVACHTPHLGTSEGMKPPGNGHSRFFMEVLQAGQCNHMPHLSSRN